MLEKTYRPADFEGRLYDLWETSGGFAGRPGGAEPWCVMMPPPNVTGSLHMGHALNNTLQDVLTRYRRKTGRNALWQPGMDHAGIATQMVVERQLAGEGTDRRALGRDAFIDRVWSWKAESGGAIGRQLRRLGASPDWARERFTMDEGLSRAVIEVFVTLYRQGLIYRDKRLVNWDPVLGTAISDLEVEQREMKDGKLWHIRYPVAGRPGRHIVVATTRPETMLGDTAVAVHPEDARYRELIGSDALLPLVGRRLPIVADDHADPEQGSGAVKITPAHDFNDFEVGRRHDLAVVNVLRRRGEGQRERAGSLPGPRQDGGAQARARRPPSAGPDREGGAARPHRAARRPLGRSDRALAHGPVVRRCRDAGEARHRGGGDGPHPLRAPALGEHLFRVDAQHPALVHLAPALVGAPHPGVVRAGRPRLRRRHRGRGGGAGGAALRPERAARPRRGRAGHLVLIGPLAVLDARLARADGRARDLLPQQRPDHRLRHHLLLGRPDGDAGHALHGRCPLPHRLHPRAGAGREGAEDVQEQGQRHRPAGADRHLRRRRAALHAGGDGGAGARHQARREPRRRLPQLRDQALERGALLRGERVQAARGLRSGRGRGPGQLLDRGRGRPGRPRGHGSARRLPLRRGGGRGLPLHLGRLLRLVPGVLEARTLRPGRGGEGRDPGDGRVGAGYDPGPAASLHAVRHRGALGADRRGPGRHAHHGALARAGRKHRRLPTPRARWTGWCGSSPRCARSAPR